MDPLVCRCRWLHTIRLFPPAFILLPSFFPPFYSMSGNEGEECSKFSGELMYQVLLGVLEELFFHCNDVQVEMHFPVFDLFSKRTFFFFFGCTLMSSVALK